MTLARGEQKPPVLLGIQFPHLRLLLALVTPNRKRETAQVQVDLMMMSCLHVVTIVTIDHEDLSILLMDKVRRLLYQVCRQMMGVG